MRTLAAGGDVLASTRAVGRVVLPHAEADSALELAGVAVHLAISLGWGVVLAAALPRRHPAVAGAVAGLLIAGVDLGILGRRLPTIQALPLVPQVLDHVLYGAVVGAALSRRR